MGSLDADEELTGPRASAMTTLSAGLGAEARSTSTRRAPARADGLWFEVHPENYMVDGRPAPRVAGGDPPRAPALAARRRAVARRRCGARPARISRGCAALVRRFEPALVSEHLAWSHWDGAYRPDLLPFPRTRDALRRIADNVARTQDALGRAHRHRKSVALPRARRSRLRRDRVPGRTRPPHRLRACCSTSTTSSSARTTSAVRRKAMSIAFPARTSPRSISPATFGRSAARRPAARRLARCAGARRGLGALRAARSRASGRARR